MGSFKGISKSLAGLGFKGAGCRVLEFRFLRGARVSSFRLSEFKYGVSVVGSEVDQPLDMRRLSMFLFVVCWLVAYVLYFLPSLNVGY